MVEEEAEAGAEQRATLVARHGLRSNQSKQMLIPEAEEEAKGRVQCATAYRNTS